MFSDPLRINYIAVRADDRLEETSPFQGFDRSWSGLIWALELLAQLPLTCSSRSVWVRPHCATDGRHAPAALVAARF